MTKEAPADESRPASPADQQQQSMDVNVVELGSSLDRVGGGGGRAAAGATAARRRRKQSPMTKLMNSMNLGHGGGQHHQQRPKRSSRRQTARSGEKKYQGRMNRRAQHQDEHQEHQQSPGQQSPGQQPRQQPQQHQEQHQQQRQQRQQRSSQNPQQQTNNQRRAGAAPWSEIKNNIRRKSRDGAERLRRLSISAGDHAYNMRRRRASVERQQNQHQQHNRRTSIDNSERRELDQLRKQMKQKKQMDSSNRGGGGQQQQPQKKRESASSSGAKSERQMAQPVGHALKENGTNHSERNGGLGQKKLSKSMLDTSDDNVEDFLKKSSQPDGQDEPKETESTENKRRAMLSNRRASLDSSLRDLQSKLKDCDDGQPRRPVPRRRLSLESSMKLGESDRGRDMERTTTMPRRRSNSCDNLHDSWKASGRDSTARRASFTNSSDEKIMNRPGDEEEDLIDEMIRKDSAAVDASKDDKDEDLLNLFSGFRKGSDNQRKTHTGVIDRSKSDLGGDKDKTKRKSEFSARTRGSYDAKKIEAAKQAWDDSHKHGTGRTSNVSTVGNKKNRSSTSKKDGMESPCAEDSVNSKGSNTSNTYDNDSSGRRNKRKKKKSGVRIKPLALCTMCLCYCLSIVLFGGLGFWLHMNFFSDSNEDDSADGTTIASAPGTVKDNDGNNDAGSKNTNGGQGVTAPTPGPSSYNNNTQSNMNSEGGLAIKLSPSSLGPSFLSSRTPTYPRTSTPSYMPSTTLPSDTPSYYPTLQPSLSNKPSTVPSGMPSFSPTSIPGCPDELFKKASLGNDGSLTLKYEVVIYPETLGEEFGGGLLCVSLEYEGDASWIGLALSKAPRNPQYGRKEAIIGVPGMLTSSAVGMDGSASLGQQISALESKKQPAFANPGKYTIPAGGIEGMGKKAGYYGPSLKVLQSMDKQTLVNGTVSIVDPYALGGIVSNQSKRHTVLSFAKYLREPGEIQIDPFGSTLLLYAVAPLDVDDEKDHDGNPEWKSTYLKFLDDTSSLAVKKSDWREDDTPVRKRKRQHDGE